MALNTVAIAGNLTRDPELAKTKNGGSVLTLSVAVNDRQHNTKTDEWEDHANYFDCTLFGKRAESLADILVKGQKVAIQGKLRQQRWETDEGQKRSRVCIMVSELDFMNPAKKKAKHSEDEDELPF